MLNSIPTDNALSLLYSLSEVKLMDLTAKIVRLAHMYMGVVEEQERGCFDNGYTATELDARRTRLHNQFLGALKESNIDTSSRADTTDFARKIVSWIPSEEDNG